MVGVGGNPVKGWVRVYTNLQKMDDVFVVRKTIRVTTSHIVLSQCADGSALHACRVKRGAIVGDSVTPKRQHCCFSVEIVYK